MKSIEYSIFIILVCFLCFPTFIQGQDKPNQDSATIPKLADGAETQWVESIPHEILGTMITKPSLITDRIPDSLRLIRLKDFAENPSVNKHLKQHPDHSDWAISIIEFIHQKKFIIDGQNIDLTDKEGTAFWFVPVASRNKAPNTDIEQVISMGFWMPDSAFVNYLRSKGIYANYGEVQFYNKTNGQWIGRLETEKLNLEMQCIPAGKKQATNPGKQIHYPPLDAQVDNYVRVAFSGQSVQRCSEKSYLKTGKNHPLSKSLSVFPNGLSYIYGTTIRGGTYSN
jgi:hypothetical protein